MNQILIIMSFIFFNTLGIKKQEISNNDFQWPNGKMAAVCLTYDDGLESHFANAIPDLEAAGFRGTFYLMGTNLKSKNIDRWREVAANGHELGCHSLFHPCGADQSWVLPEYQTEKYSVRQMLTELKVMNAFLYAIDGKTERTYGYPCHVKEVGGVYYVDSLRKEKLFSGARNGYAPELKRMKDLNLFDIPSKSIQENVPLEDVINYIETAVKNRTIAVFCMHGVGGDYIVTDKEKHHQLIEYLKKNNNKLWVAPLNEVSTYIAKEQKRLGWE